jgi:glycosyltransferase involved in cell wall biosynthesis
MAPFPTLAEVFDPMVKRRLPSTDVIREAFAGVVGKPFDVVLCYKLISAMVFDHAQSIVNLSTRRKVVDFDDIQSIADKRAAAYERYGIEQSVIEALMRRQIRRAETRCLATYDAVCVCSLTDREKLLLRRAAADIHVIPNSIQLPAMSLAADACAEVRLLFVGTLSYGPNHDGIVWFCREILPMITARSPLPVKLTIVGFDPTPEVRALESVGHITIAGNVDAVAPFYRHSDIVIAPIRYGGGTRIKILEAMSYQRPVISTSLGAEGIGAIPDAQIIIGDTAEAFAARCLNLIGDQKSRAAIGLAGYHLINEQYSEQVVSDAIRAVV